MSKGGGTVETWAEVIKNYINELGDEKSKDEYHDFLLSYFYCNKLYEAKPEDIVKSKELNNKLKKINKIKVTSNNKKILEQYYKEFISNNWIKDTLYQCSFWERKSCFYNIWICRSLIMSEGVYPATHIAKLTHSSSSASSIWDNTLSENAKYISTASLRNKIIDGAYPDAALSKNVKFLMLTYKDKLLATELINGNTDALKDLSESDEELFRWITGFQKILINQPISANLAKQVYFPVSDDYHLLTILKSSPLMQVIYDGYFEKSAKKNQAAFGKSKEKKKYRSGEYNQPVNVARISTTLSQPQNVSVLNGKRGGYIRLFSAQPPIWKSQLKPPISFTSFFYAGFGHQNIKENVNYLCDFLSRFEKLGLSIRDPKKKKWIQGWLSNIIDEVLLYAANIQNIPAGWSQIENIKLKREHQYFLDPYRDDAQFQKKRNGTDWQSVICRDFANWLNGKLKGRDKKFTPQREHEVMWKKIMKDELREYMQMVEVDIKFQNREQQV